MVSWNRLTKKRQMLHTMSIFYFISNYGACNGVLQNTIFLSCGDANKICEEKIDLICEI